ncbi:hypothetical protein EGW08_005407 [Elysia chlorotica]|uniref:Uncharacterized protein n=1 Tax=Elysia chlorotica TaxID=188477 RepID=A0A3S1BF28_ELYCH|nr:hypothetical protein EGW08_005407 [Elysia chlorotica]
MRVWARILNQDEGVGSNPVQFENDGRETHVSHDLGSLLKIQERPPAARTNRSGGVLPLTLKSSVNSTSKALEVRSTDSFTKDSSCNSSSTTASMQPANIILKRQKLFPAIDLSQCWKDAQHRADAVNSGLNQVGGYKTIDHGTNSDRERVRPNQSTLYLDTSRYMPSAYGTGVPEALRAEHHVEDDQRNKTPEHWISERAPSTNYSTLHDIGSLENATKPEISLQNTESHCHHKSSYISSSRHSLEHELLKRRTGNGLEKQRTSNIHSTMYFPSIESSHHVKTNDNDVRSGKRARVLHSHDCTDDEQESNHSHCRSVNLERGKGRSSMLHVVHARDALFEVPRRSSPFISRLELLEGLFFTPASHAQPVTSSWDTSPGLGEGLRDITLSRVASVTSRYSRDTETPLAYKEGVDYT